MQSKWPFLQISECAKVYSGFAFKSQDLGEDGIPVVKIKNVNNRTVDIADTQFFPEELITDKHGRFFLDDGDVLIAMTGQGSVGRVGRLSNSSNRRILLNQRVGKFIPNQNLDLRYFYYVASSSYYEDIFFNAGLGSGQPNLSPDVIGQVEIPLPPLPEQKTIAHILGSLDDKIELNRRMNATLEGMAQALFKSWFVDFDPVIDNALAAGNPIPDELAPRAEVRRKALANGTANREAAKAFPASFQETEELGWIPEGWEASHMVENVRLTMGQSPSSDHYNKDGNGLPFHQGVTNYGERFPKHEQYSTGGNRYAEERDVLFSVRAPVGRINIANCQLIIGRGLSALRHKKGYQGFLVYFLKHTFAKEDSIGSGTIFNAVNKKEMERIPLITASDHIAKAFNDIANSLDEKIASNAERSENLTKLRDTLLPKLISGELTLI